MIWSIRDAESLLGEGLLEGERARRCSDDISKWDRLALTWMETTPPAIPSSDDLAIYSDLISRMPRRSRVCLLGCTPSIRRLFGSDGPFGDSELVCVDLSLAMYNKTTAALDLPSARESFIQADWRELGSVIRDPVELIIGDKSADNVPWEYWPGLLESLERALRPRGALILHVAFPDPAVRGRSVQEVVAPWVDKLSRAACTLDDAASGLWDDLLNASAANANRRLSLDGFIDDLLGIQTTGVPQASSIAARLLTLFGGSLADSWTCYDLGDLVDATAPWFRLDDLRYSSDYEASRYQPLVQLRRRK